MIEALQKELEQKMDKALKSFQEELTKIRTGRASPSLLDSVLVDYYGTMTPVSQMAGISVPEARLLIITPWDAGSLPAIDKAIQKSDIGILPQNDGKVIRLAMPALTEERRKTFVKLVNKLAEESKIAIRNIRRLGMEDLKKAEKDKTINEDEVKKAQEKVQAVTDRHIKRADEIGEQKAKEILEI